MSKSDGWQLMPPPNCCWAPRTAKPWKRLVSLPINASRSVYQARSDARWPVVFAPLVKEGYNRVYLPRYRKPFFALIYPFENITAHFYDFGLLPFVMCAKAMPKFSWRECCPKTRSFRCNFGSERCCNKCDKGNHPYYQN